MDDCPVFFLKRFAKFVQHVQDYSYPNYQKNLALPQYLY